MLVPTNYQSKTRTSLFVAAAALALAILLLGLVDAGSNGKDFKPRQALGKQEILDRLKSNKRPLLEPSVAFKLMEQFKRLDNSDDQFDAFLEAARLDAAKCKDHLYTEQITKIVDKMVRENKSVYPNLVHYLYDCRIKQKQLCLAASY